MAFDVTTPGPQAGMNFLSLCIYCSLTGTSIDQTEHIQTKILAPWFPPGSQCKITHTPIKAHPTHEAKLDDDIPICKTDLPHFHTT